MCVYSGLVCLMPREASAVDLLGLDLQTLVNSHVDVRNQTSSTLEEQPMPLSAQLGLQPLCLLFFAL